MGSCVGREGRRHLHVAYIDADDQFNEWCSNISRDLSFYVYLPLFVSGTFSVNLSFSLISHAQYEISWNVVVLVWYLMFVFLCSDVGGEPSVTFRPHCLSSCHWLCHCESNTQYLWYLVADPFRTCLFVLSFFLSFLFRQVLVAESQFFASSSTIVSSLV